MYTPLMCPDDVRMRKYRKTPWTSPIVRIGQSSIHGKGMFATAPIAKGELVVIWGGNFVKKKAAEEAMKKPDFRVQQIDDDVFEVFSYQNRGDDPTYFHNHSCDPNTWMKDQVTVNALRKINANQELTIDYAMFETNEDWKMTEECNCGSSNCRGKISGEYWRLPELQERYRNHFLPLINRRISSGNT